jgi:hypothetical protein
MDRFWRTALAGIVLVLGLFGCSGQTTTGAWYGPLPLKDAKECRIRIFENRTFDFSCQQDRWLGAGKVTVLDKKLVFKCLAVSESGKVRKTNLPTFEIPFEGRGNELNVTFPDGSQHRWFRAYRPPPQPNF